MNRLSSAQESGSWSQTNSYDRYGNRSIIGGGLSFDSSNNRIVGYSYDASGNLTNDGAHTYQYDAEGKIKTVDGVANTYQYDGEGYRVKKYYPLGEQVRFIYGVSGQLVAEFDSSTGALKQEYIDGVSGLLATVEPSIGTKYTTADNLGSPRVVTNAGASVVSRHDYMPFGEELFAGTGGRTTGQGYGVADNVREKFTGYQRDGEINLDYAQARYYSSSQGRFTSADPFAGSMQASDPQSFNRYSYVGNNPLNRTDPTGLDWTSSASERGDHLIMIIISAAAGVCLTLLAQVEVLRVHRSHHIHRQRPTIVLREQQRMP